MQNQIIPVDLNPAPTLSQFPVDRLSLRKRLADHLDDASAQYAKAAAAYRKAVAREALQITKEIARGKPLPEHGYHFTVRMPRDPRPDIREVLDRVTALTTPTITLTAPEFDTYWRGNFEALRGLETVMASYLPKKAR